MPAVMPGTTSYVDARLAQHLRLLAAAPEHERVAALEAHDQPAGRGVLDAAAGWSSSCGTCSPPPCLPTKISSASSRAPARISGPISRS